MANGNLPYPFPDAVSQFSVESTVLGAQDGGHVGGMVNVVTGRERTSTTATGFEFIRNNYIDATNFFHLHVFRHDCSRRTRSTRISSAARSAARSSATRCLPSPAYQRSKADQSQAGTKPPCPRRRTWRAIIPPPTAVRYLRTVQLEAMSVPAGRPADRRNPGRRQVSRLSRPIAAALALQKYLPGRQSGGRSEQLRVCLLRHPVSGRRQRVCHQGGLHHQLRRTNLMAGTSSTVISSRRTSSPTNILITTQSGNIRARADPSRWAMPTASHQTS